MTAVIESSPRSAKRIDPPLPLVKLSKHPVKGVRNKLQSILIALIMGLIGMAVIVGLYYVCLETNPTITAAWHHLVSDSTLRHNIRSVGEGLLGGLLPQATLWNSYKRRSMKVHLIDRVEHFLHVPNLKFSRPLTVPQVFMTPLLVLIYASVGFVAGQHIASFLHAQAHWFHGVNLLGDPNKLSPTTASVATKVRNGVTLNWDKKLLGYVASFFFGRRPAKPVFSAMQLWFVERRISAGKKLRWYHPPAFKARFNEVSATEDYQSSINPRTNTMLTWLIRISVPVGIGLAIVGEWVLLTKAS